MVSALLLCRLEDLLQVDASFITGVFGLDGGFQLEENEFGGFRHFALLVFLASVVCGGVLMS